MSVRLLCASSAVAWLLLLFFFQLASAQTDPAACSVSCRFVIVPTLGPQGLPGLNGTKGDTGAIGQEGQKGDKGDQGEPGIDGVDGKDGINGTNGVDGKDATFDSTATYIGLKLEAPVLTGALSIDGAALTGSTSIGESATILQPSITAPVIDGAAIIGEGATLVKPTITAPLVDGAEIHNSNITGSTVNGTVITKSETNGHFRLTDNASLGIGGSISESTGANPGYAMINATMTGNLLTTDVATFFPVHVGNVIEWADGLNAVIQSAGPEGPDRTAAINATMTTTLETARDWQMVKMWLGSTMLSSSFAMFQDKIALKGWIAGSGTAAITIDATKMRTDANIRHQTSWTFPHPGPAGQLNYFVGEQTVQTLSKKTIASPTVTGQLSMTGKSALLSFAASTANCVGNQTFDELVIETTCGFGYGSIGDVIEWEDGTTANIVDTGVPNLQGGTWTATLLKDGGPVNRTNAAFKVYSSSGPRNNRGALLSPMVSALTGRLVLRGGLDGYGGTSAVSINMFKLDSGNQRYHARWSFPRPPMDRTDNSWEFFVGEKTIQTLSNKKFARILGEGTQPTLTLWSGTGTAGTGVATLKSGSNELAGTVVVTIGTGPLAAGNFLSINFVTNRHGGPCFVSLTPGNPNAARLSGGAQVYVDVDTATFNGWIIRSPPDTPLAASTTYAWTYHVIG